MSKITLSSKGENCTVRIPGVCNFNPDTTIAAHLSGVRHGHGVGIKVTDILIAYTCSNCHDVLDNRVGSHYTRDQIKLMHMEGIAETQIKLIEKGLIKL